ncbi:MAG: citryl-CoA lyase [Candidatus Thermoplasmatota archaeon]
MEEVVWKSAITKVEPNHLVTRGYRQEELIGNVPYAHVVFLLLKGRLPEEEEGKMMDAILTSSIDHGTTPPSTLASRVIASASVPLPTAVAGGILAIGDAHGGAIENCAKFLQESVANKDEKDYDKIAEEIVKEKKAKGEIIPGYGHRFHTSDPRTIRLYKLAEELKIAGKHVAFSKAIENALFNVSGRKLPINVDGAIAAIVSDMGFDPKLGKAFFLLGRVAGLVAHVYEEITREKQMRRLSPSDCDYDGPWERELPAHYREKK